MGSQIAILGTPEDMSELLDIAAKQGARALPEFVVGDEAPDLQEPGKLFRAHPSEKLYLLPRDLEAVEIFTTPGTRSDGLEAVNDRTSPVVQLVPPEIDGDRMRAGRLFLGMSSSDSRYRYVKPLYDALKKAVERWPKAEPGGIRVGPHGVVLAQREGKRLESMIGERLTLAKGKTS
jgi:hypothetical protein